MSEYVKEIDGAQLKELLAAGKTVVCDFWASWCGPCRMLAPVMDEVAKEFSDKAEFVKIDVDLNNEAAAEYGVMSIPYVVVLKDGEVKAKNLGFVPAEVMREFLKGNL